MIQGYIYPSSQPKIIKTQSEVDNFFPKKREIYEPEEGEVIAVVARHGANISNEEHTYDGKTLNKPLTKVGFKQSLDTGKKLKGKIKQVDHVVTNSMVRTGQSAQEILKAFPECQPTFSQDDRLFERYVGKYEGKSLTELEPTNSEDKRVSDSTEISFEEKMRFSPEIGEIESYAAIWERARQGLIDISQKIVNETSSKRGTVLVVSHSGTQRALYWHLANQLGYMVPYRNFKPENGACLIASIKGNEINLLETTDFKIYPNGKD